MATLVTRRPTAELMVEVKNKLIDALGNLNGIWDDIGLPEEQKGQRVNLVFRYIADLIEEMVQEEEKRRSTLKNNIESYKAALSQLCAELHVAPIQPIATQLFEIERELKQAVGCWQTEKDNRLRDMKELSTIEQSLCDKMQITPSYNSPGVVPTKEQLTELRQRTDKLAAELAKRYDVFTETRERAAKIVADIGEDVVTEFEQDVIIEDPECFVLSSGNMNKLEDLSTKLQNKFSRRVEAMNQLRGKIEALWGRLETKQKERDLVSNQISDHTLSSMNILKEELDRCEVLKFEHIQDFTLKIRQELSAWWDKCHYSKSQRNSFSPFESGEFSEELLIQHEEALEAVKQFYTENEHLLRKIEKRTELWNQMVTFDMKENDPNRFRNRGGNLLAEEREKKKVLHQLPKVEEQLKNEIEEWEKENNKQFLIGGMQFFEHCRLQWEEYKLSKELQKQQRLEQKEKEKQSEIKYGSKPTPAKRRFCAANGTTNTPKHRKLNDTARSATPLHSLSKMHSVFTSPMAPSNSTRTPLRSAKPASSFLDRTPISARKPPLPRTPLYRTPAKTPGATMGPPRTPMSSTMSTRSTARKLTKTDRTKSCAALASPTLKPADREMQSAAKMKKAKSERRLNRENTTPPSCGTSVEDVVSLSSDVEPISSYEEFEHVLQSAQKSKCRSTLCPPK